MRLCSVYALLLLLSACSGDKPPAEEAKPAASTGPSAAEQEALAKVKAAAEEYQAGLHRRLKDAAPGADPARSLQTYATSARTLGAVMRSSSGVRVGRSALRLRNPKNIGPDWVQTWLSAQGQRPAAGLEAVARVESTAEGDMARVILPVAEEASCLACHGAPEGFSPELKTALAAGWPEDKATGYAEGDLAGAIWAEMPVKKKPVAGLRAIKPGE